jgi:hypothetical protein
MAAQYGARMNPATVRELDQNCTRTATALTAARTAFENAMNKYQSLGGSVNYRLQLLR